ncbi:fibrinogen-like YCDxxxxGGGW domain-containing protein [Pseudoalteromonas piscicida]
MACYNNCALIFLLISGEVVAQSSMNVDILSGNYYLKLDNIHNGVLVNEVTSEITLSGFDKHFVGADNDIIISGAKSLSGKAIKFQMTELDSKRSVFFSGSNNGIGGFNGSWHASDGSEGDWNLGKVSSPKFTTCNQILSAGLSTGNGVYQIIDDDNQALSVYCDMTSDGGGWTLVGSYPSKEAGGKERINDYGSLPEINPSSPSRLWMYKGDLSKFSDAREQIACVDGAECVSGKFAYANNLQAYELDLIRYTWGYLDRGEHMPKLENVPSCRTEYSYDQPSFTGCVNPAYLKWDDNVYRSTYQVGWQVDLYGTTHCWAARGEYNRTMLGSSLCVNNGEPNGRNYALLWMR